MMEEDWKTWKKIKFYHKYKQDVVFLTDGITILGKIVEISLPFMRRWFILKSNQGEILKIYLDDVDENSLFPPKIISDHVKQREEKREQEKETKKPRQGVPQSLRKELWHNFFGNQWTGKCFVCKSDIDKENFEAAHVTAVTKGGEDTLDNLRPTCKTCNRSMGDTDLNEFKLQYH